MVPFWQRNLGASFAAGQQAVQLSAQTLGGVAVTYQEALAAAQNHVAEAPLDHPDYRMGFSQGRRIPEGWYFDYVVEPVRPVPVSEQEQFAGAPGFIIPSSGATPRVVTWDEFSERKLDEAPLAG